MLLNSNYGIISCFSLPAARYFRGPKVPKGPRFLERKLPKNQKVSAAVLHPSVSLSRRYSEFSMGRSSSLTPPYGAPSLLKLPASFCLRRPIKNSGWRGSIGVWIKVFNFFVGFLLVTFLFQKKSDKDKDQSSESSFILIAILYASFRGTSSRALACFAASLALTPSPSSRFSVSSRLAP